MVTAIIPCGGRGTRLATLTRDTPKELLPVHGKPLLQWTLEEAAAAGLDRVVVVTSPTKPQIAQFLSPQPVQVVEQPEPRGLGDAITRVPARGDSVAVMLPDNLFDADDPPPIGRVLAAHRATGLAAVLLARVAREQAGAKGATGRARCAPRPDGWLTVHSIAGKGTAEERFDTGGDPAALTPIGRMVFGPDVFDLLEEQRRLLRPGEELDDVPLLQRLAREGRLVGVEWTGAFHDVGVPEGYAAAQR